jgi:type I restriction enzyme M protein
VGQVRKATKGKLWDESLSNDGGNGPPEQRVAESLEANGERVGKRSKRGARKARAEGSVENGNGIVALTKELWQAAVNLRGSIEPADYKRYVLPIIFLRFLSLRYERRRAELETLIADPKSDYHGDKAVLEEPDEYRAGGAFIVPREARWDWIREHAQADDIKLKLDNILELLEKTYPDKLRGLLPRIYAGSNLDRENVTGLINLFSKDVFREKHGGEDLIGRVYEYFIGEFASSEGKRGGEYFTPLSIVRTLVAMLEPTEGVVFDPCCGSGGMFVQSDEFTRHNRRLSFVGQESKDFTYRLCRMNLFIHGIDGNIRMGNSYFDDQHATVKADYILANPPFNDGSKGENGWGADRVPDKDPRLAVGGTRLPLSPRNANTMWMLHFLYHLKEGGTAGFVMAAGEASNSNDFARLEVRKALIEGGYVDCIVQLTGQLFANTPVPCCLWFLSKSRDGTKGCRPRRGEVLFLDGRKLGTLIPGSRKQKQLSNEEIERLAAAYRRFRRKDRPEESPGFCRVATIDEIRAHNYALTPGRYVGAADGDDEDEPFEEKFPRLVALLNEQLQQSADLDHTIARVLAEVGDGV